ncbi:MAG: DUF2723 domain-containing protein [Candidatus Cryptobacteroides sp.]|nr:DUF2723 domain-containing protein [Candidatus Cryptobacteroides sp.]
MDKKKFRLWNIITSLAVFVVAAVTYISTIEPTASFWDCGEFIASSYKLEVGHPPGNPVFQLIARFFTMFTDASGAAVAVNVMSALCSALTIYFLYLTIVFFAKRLTGKKDGYTLPEALAIFGSGAVGALAYCFSDTFWFSAVEGEVYAMSSLFTALVFWAMTKWYEQADQPGSSRWIVLISFLMGLSIGVHLLNLLAIPAIVFMYFYRKHEDDKLSLKQCFGFFLLSVVILGLLVFMIIPYLPKIAAYVDLFFVNTLGLPVNSGAAFFLVAVLGLCFWGLFKTYDAGKVFWNTALLCLTTIVIGFSIFSIVIIRASVKTPTNENQPDNAFSLVRYLSREQYGSSPLVYGQYFDAPYDTYIPKYWALVGDKYVKVDGPIAPRYKSSGKMLFPRMWGSSGDGRYEEFYESYMNGNGHSVPGAQHKKPTFGTNLSYFFDYQLNWMYWRYFMWNFAGRQNDVHSPSPGNIFDGNWESGITFLDEFRLGDQSAAPAPLSENKGKNHYYMLPLLLGLIGLFFQFEKDKRGSWLVFLMFFMTGIAIVIYLNQPPYQVRERDYAYAGSFYMFSIWIGFAVLALYQGVKSLLKGRESAAVAAGVTVACLLVPALMAAENWDDHDRSNRYTAVEMAKNYLNSVGPNGFLITHGDNDTFPLWYAQEVENVRHDVRLLNTSLLGTDWYIDQMKYAINESAPLPLTIPQTQYLYGTNDYVFVNDTRNQVIPIADVMRVFKHSDAKLALQDGRRVDYIMSRKISVPVNKENALKSGIVPAEFADLMLDEIILEIPKDKTFLSKQELFFLDLLAGYEWDRPINMLSSGGEINVGQRKYLMYEGFSSKLVPFENKTSGGSIGKVDADDLYDKIMNVYKWDALKRTDYYVDYQNLYTFLGVINQREVFVNVADALIQKGEFDKAKEVLDKCLECVPFETYPIESVCVGFSSNDLRVINMISQYYLLGEPDKAREIASRFSTELLKDLAFHLEYIGAAYDQVGLMSQIRDLLVDVLQKGGDKEMADRINESFGQLIEIALGDSD